MHIEEATNNCFKHNWSWLKSHYTSNMQRNVDIDVTQRPCSDVGQFLCYVMDNTKVDFSLYSLKGNWRGCTSKVYRNGRSKYIDPHRSTSERYISNTKKH